jgi:hypothetical protein
MTGSVGTGSREENALKQKALDPTASILRLTVAGPALWMRGNSLKINNKAVCPGACFAPGEVRGRAPCAADHFLKARVTKQVPPTNVSE